MDSKKMREKIYYQLWPVIDEKIRWMHLLELVQYAVNLHVQAHGKGETITKTRRGQIKLVHVKWW
ncbi:MAG: hypothetical protein Q8N08_09180 [Methanobacteriaceae archaeon]|nr:hypothetical protein [Methanobacteriaceae archaeon]